MSQADTVDKQPELKRVMGPGLLLLFIVGDILGTGVYALTGDVAAEVGGAAWIPFLVAFLIATVTAFSYLELVTKYPQAAGAALYAHKAFGIQFVTFLIAFVVMCSGITSASTASRFFAANFFEGFDFRLGHSRNRRAALLFMAAAGAGQPAWGRRKRQAQRLPDHHRDHRPDAGDRWSGCGHSPAGATSTSPAWSRSTPPADKNAFMAVTAATSLAFFAMVGFEDSVNMAEETKDPVKIFPEGAADRPGASPGIVYILVAIVAVALVPVGTLEPRAKPRSSRSSRPVRPGCRSTTSSRSSRCSRCPTRR